MSKQKRYRISLMNGDLDLEWSFLADDWELSRITSFKIVGSSIEFTTTLHEKVWIPDHLICTSVITIWEEQDDQTFSNP